MIVFAAIAPHGDVDEPPELLAAMEELGRAFDAASPDAAIVVTPHNVHVEGHFAVVVAAKVGEHEVDRELAAAALDALRAQGLPVVGVSYGGNDATQAEHPLDWGTEIPLRFMRAAKVVVVCPARDRPLAEHVRAGEALARLPGRLALIASADQGHAHDPEGPYGFDPAAASPSPQSSGCWRLRCLRIFFLIRAGVLGRSLLLRLWRGIRALFARAERAPARYGASAIGAAIATSIP